MIHALNHFNVRLSVKSGHLPPDIVLDRRNKLSQAWFRLDHQPALAELACAAVLATHGFLNYNFQLSRMNLRPDMQTMFDNVRFAYQTNCHMPYMLVYKCLNRFLR